MTTARPNTQEGSALYIKGRTIKAHIDRANSHLTKYDQHAKSAGILLAEAKAEVPHGQWYAWLDEHGIKHSTASKLMRDHSRPESAEIKRQYDRAYRAKEREQNATTRSDLDSKPTPSPRPVNSKPTPNPQPTAEVKVLVHERVRRMVSELTEEQAGAMEDNWDAVVAFLKTL